MHFKVFTTQFCPNCPAVKDRIAALEAEMKSFTVEYINAGEAQGLEEARKHEVSHVPTVIAFDGEEEKSRAHSVEEVEKLIG